MILENNIRSLLDNTFKSLGFEIVRVRYSGDKRKTLQIMIDRLDGNNITLDDCEKISKVASDILDVEEVINEPYSLEISSPGIDRPLTKINDFIRYKGYLIKLSTITKIDGRRNFTGKIFNVEENKIILEIADSSYIPLDFNVVDSAKLLITEELMRKFSNKTNKGE